jgi:hypothetical protein
MTTTIPDVPVPPGARPDSWQDDSPLPYRFLFGVLRNTDGVEHTTVQATAVQYTDGRIDDGGVHEAPSVYLGDDGLSSSQARELAAALIETADEVDGWAGVQLPKIDVGPATPLATRLRQAADAIAELNATQGLPSERASVSPKFLREQADEAERGSPPSSAAARATATAGFGVLVRTATRSAATTRPGGSRIPL